MGLLLNGLWDHEGTAHPWPTTPDGIAHDGQPRGYLAACSCGWQALEPQASTLAGHQAALEAWLVDHACPLLAAHTATWRWELRWWLRLLGTHARRLKEPADLDRLAAALAQAQQLVAALQQARPGRARLWETNHGR
jgi:hypothetical protein